MITHLLHKFKFYFYTVAISFLSSCESKLQPQILNPEQNNVLNEKVINKKKDEQHNEKKDFKKNNTNNYLANYSIQKIESQTDLQPLIPPEILSPQSGSNKKSDFEQTLKNYVEKVKQFIDKKTNILKLGYIKEAINLMDDIENNESNSPINKSIKENFLFIYL